MVRSSGVPIFRVNTVILGHVRGSGVPIFRVNAVFLGQVCWGFRCPNI